MIEKIKKFKDVIKDLIYNTLGFGIYIAAQQILLMPIMARIFPEEDFSRIVLYVSIFAIITNVLGSELGIVRQVKREKVTESSDYNRILLQLFPVVVLLSIVLLIVLHFNVIEIIFFTVTIILGNLRLYSAAYFRANKDFKKIIFQNIIYTIGIAIGLGITYKLKVLFIPMLLAELLCMVYDFIKTDLLSAGIQPTKDNKSIWISFRDFGFISFLVNMITYFDKIIIYPILGENAVAIYYATSSMAKIIGLITNPLHGVILSWLKENDKEFKSKVTKLTLKANVPILLLVFIVSIPITYLAIKVLYPQYLQDSMLLIMPICIGLAFNTVATIVKAILMKYVESKKLVVNYVIYIFALVVLAIVMSYLHGIIGFAYATAIAKMLLWILFMFTLYKVSKSTGNIIEKENKNGK